MIQEFLNDKFENWGLTLKFYNPVYRSFNWMIRKFKKKKDQKKLQQNFSAYTVHKKFSMHQWVCLKVSGTAGQLHIICTSISFIHLFITIYFYFILTTFSFVNIQLYMLYIYIMVYVYKSVPMLCVMVSCSCMESVILVMWPAWKNYMYNNNMCY